MIEEIYASKEKYDQKYFDTGKPRETMEEHMYTYLNQKFGLKVNIFKSQVIVRIQSLNGQVKLLLE